MLTECEIRDKIMDYDVVKFQESVYLCTYNYRLIFTADRFSLSLLFSYKRIEQVYMEAQQYLLLSIITISSINNKLYIDNHQYYLSFNKLVYQMIKDTSKSQHQDTQSSYSPPQSTTSLQSELGLSAFLQELKTATALVQAMKSPLNVGNQQDLPQKVKLDLEKQRSDKTWLLERYDSLEKKFQSLAIWVQKRQSELEKKNKKIEKRLQTLGKRAWQFQGDKLFIEGKYKQVIELSQDILKAVPQLNQQFEGLGNIEDRTGILENDIASWYKDHWQNHSNPYDLLCLSHSLLQTYDEAEKWYSYRLGKDKDNYKLIFGLANILYNTGRFDKAEQFYKKVTQLKPDFEKSYRMIAFIKIIKQNKKEEGKVWAILSKQKRRNNVFADYLLALCEDKATDQILKLQGLLQELQTPYPRLYNAIGSAYLEKKEYEESIKFFKKSIETSPNFQIPYYNLGLAYQEKQQFDEAILEFQQCLAHNPKYNNALVGLGNIYSKKGDKDKSVQYYQKCLQITSNHLGALSGLGRVLALHNDYEQAAKYFNRCLQLNADHLISLNSLGNIHFYKGQLDEAIGFYKRSVQLNPQYATPYNGLCRAFGKKGDQAEARKWLQKKESIKSS